MGGRAAIYARFSSHNQRGESIEIQVEKSRAYCEANDLRVVATYCDFAQTGTNTDRAEFQRMMADAKRGLFDFVVIYKVTRIMRNRDEMAMARIMLRRCRVEILYAGEDISDGSAGVLQLGMLEVLAEYESALDGERIRDGIQKNAERCMANGCVRYGWDIVDGRYAVNEEEAAAIRLGVRMVLSGKSVADVVRAWEPYRTKRGGKWRFQTVRRILMRRENGGEYRYAGVVVPGGMPAIVPMDDEERVIRMLEDSHRPRAKTEAWDFPLTGKLYDGAKTAADGPAPAERASRAGPITTTAAAAAGAPCAAMSWRSAWPTPCARPWAAPTAASASLACWPTPRRSAPTRSP